jgi:hypothetical protein
VPGLINRVPQGFLSLLDLKAQGENAKELSPTLVSVLDALDFYLSPIRANVTGTVAPALGPNDAVAGTLLTAQPGEVWIVRQVSAFMAADIAAASTIELQVGWVPIVGTWVGLGSVSGVRGPAERAVSSWGHPFLLQPGDQLGFYVSVLTGAPGNVRTSAMISRLLI